MKKMTLEEFDKISHGEIFLEGILPNSPDGLYMVEDHIGRELRFIAKKGGGKDWAIYCDWKEKDVDYVQRHGQKVTSEKNIKLCVPCTDEVFKLYRY